MPVLEFITEIRAPIEVCFDLARSIDLHKVSTAGSDEEAIDGVTSGLIGFGEEVTWQATHFGIRQKLCSKITAFEYPFYFRDEMIRGAFKSINHDHRFEELEKITYMSDYFEFQSPMGLLGMLFNKLVLTNYLKKLIIKRNQVIKDYAESEQWKLILNRYER